MKNEQQNKETQREENYIRKKGEDTQKDKTEEGKTHKNDKEKEKDE